VTKLVPALASKQFLIYGFFSMPLLTSSSATVLNKSVKIDQAPVVIGRHPDCEVQVDDGSVSRRHAQIVYVKPHYYLEDLNSRNGSMLNNEFVTGRTRLFDGAEIQICDIVFRFTRSSVSPGNRSRPTLASSSKDESVYGSSVFHLNVEPSERHTDESQLVSQLDVQSHTMSDMRHLNAEAKLKVLMKIAHALSDLVERDAVLERILDFLFDLFVQADRGFVMLKDENGSLQPLGFKCRRPTDDENVRVSSTIAEMVMESRRPIISRDAAIDDRFDSKESIMDFQIRSIMCAPLINSREESIGVIQLDTLRQTIAFGEEDLEMFVTVAMQASLAIQKSDLFSLRKKTRDLRKDLSLANELQQRFLPQSAPDIDGYEFFSWYRPMQQVGGDYYDYITLDKDRVAIVVADVVGHGITAALLMAKVSAESRFALATEPDPISAVKRMNQKLSSLHIDRFVTLVLVMIDSKTHAATIVNAGHMPPVLRKASDKSLTSIAIDEAGVPLGVIDDFEYESIEVVLEQGDSLLMYTDGVNEAMNKDGRQLTTTGMIEDIRVSQAMTPEAIGQSVCESVARHSADTDMIDDACLVCVGRTK
jgi:serine phosphatase RsbU (regulator of sigma subunit)/pSer/pThr/pTyr-binding forkhead associated (FHA) protein